MSYSQEHIQSQSLVWYLANRAYNFEYSRLPQAVVNICKRALLDVTAVGIAGSETQVGKTAEVLARQFFNDQKQNASLFNGEQCSAKQAAYTNAVMAHALDMDDTCFAGIVHASVLIGPAVLALAEANQNSGEQVLTAFAVGSEITYALGTAVGSSLYENDWWPTGLLGVIGTAAALSKLKGLDEQIIARSIAFAVANATPFRCMQGTDSKPLLVGETVKRAIDAVEIAQTNLTVPLDVFEKTESPFNVTVSKKFDRQSVMQLGEQWRLIDPGLVIKLFPLCSCAQTSVEALIEIMHQNNLDQNDIESVSVTTTNMVLKTLQFDEPQDENQAMFSLTYPLACVLIDNDVKPEHISLNSINRADLKSVMTKINYQADDDLFDLDESPEAAIIKVKTNQGETFELKRLYPIGDPRSPVSQVQFRNKIKTCVGTKINVDKFINAFENIDNTNNINELTNHFKGI